MGQHKAKPESIGFKKSLNIPTPVDKNVEMMLSSCQNVNSIIQFDKDQAATPIWISTYTADIELAKYLISIGADVNIAGGNLKMTPLHVACDIKHIEFIKLLLESGANANVIDHWNFTPSIYAVLSSDPYIVHIMLDLLIQHGADMNCGALNNADSELYSTFNLNVEKLEFQYDGSLGIDTFVTQPQGPISGSALHHSAQNPYIPNEVLSLLCDAGANVNSQNLNGQTPLMRAVMDIYYDYHTSIQQHIELLLEKGAQLDIQDSRGWTALHYACQRGGLSAMESLLSSGADSSVQGSLNETPLWLLLCRGWITAAMYLIKDGCDMNSTVESRNIVKINSDVDLPRYGEVFPLEFVICNRYFDVAKLFILAGCKVDQELEYQEKDESSQHHVRELKTLYNYINNPVRLWTLKELSCRATRAAYKRSIGMKLDIVGVPHSIKDYVMLT